VSELRRLIVRHRHVAPMVSALLASVDAAVTIHDAEGAVILQRGGPDGTGPTGSGAASRAEVAVDGDLLGWVEGGRPARGIAAVLAYAAARERDKRSLANEALERYRELSLIYDLAAVIGGSEGVEPVVATAVEELSRLPHDARGFLLLANGNTLEAAPGSDGPGGPLTGGRIGTGIVGEIAAAGGAELVEDVAKDPRATGAERAGGSLVVAALRAGDVILGVVGATATGGPFRSADLKVVTAIAALAGPAIGRALGAGAGRGSETGTGSGTGSSS
jgi:putative methionine-R-sulfoxide reductase with GAF domain